MSSPYFHHAHCTLKSYIDRRSKKRVLENLAGGDVILTEAEKEEIARVLEERPVKGGRYGEKVDLALWG